MFFWGGWFVCLFHFLQFWKILHTHIYLISSALLLSNLEFLRGRIKQFRIIFLLHIQHTSVHANTYTYRHSFLFLYILYLILLSLKFSFTLFSSWFLGFFSSWFLILGKPMHHLPEFCCSFPPFFLQPTFFVCCLQTEKDSWETCQLEAILGMVIMKW